MALAIAELDDRHFQDIVDEAKKRIPYYCHEWTDHNVSDPGVTFIELFAWMTDLILFRLNQVPDRHYVKMLETMGVNLRGPLPAGVPVTFWLSAPQPNMMVIPAGTEVSSTQTETDAPIIFTTDDNFHIIPPQLAAVISRVATERAGQKRLVTHNLNLLNLGVTAVEVFTAVPQVEDALYFGFENDLSHHVLSLTLGCETAGGAGVIPSLPPILWEVSSEQGEDNWTACDIELDTSLGLNVSGRVEIHLPKMGKWRLEDKNLYWLRVRVRPIGPTERELGMLPYQVSPRLKRVAVTSVGGMTHATQAQVITNEILGRSSGEPSQRFFLKRRPILDRQPEEHLWVEVNGQLVAWQEVSDFADSSPNDRHYVLDGMTGEVRFGAVLRQPDGAMRGYGAIPPRGTTLVFGRYRTGGGLVGNVEAGVINTLKTAIPYIDRVANRYQAKGGLDAESLEDAKVRAPALLRSHERAVTAEDFEFLARQALPAVLGRVRCLQPRPSDANPTVLPGQVYVLVVPKVKYPAGYLSPEELNINNHDLETLSAYLEARRLLTTRVYVRVPAYRWVAVRVTAGGLPGIPNSVIETEILERLYRFLNPLTGGPDGNGWPFGRDLFVADVYQALQGLPNVLFIRNVELFLAASGGRPIDQPLQMVDVVLHGVIVSGIHEVVVVNE